MASKVTGALKRTTGLTGLQVAKNPHHTLTVLYGKILRALQKMPETAAYRKYTEQVIRERSQIVECTKSIPEMEKMIGCGQIEEVIVQAENELMLARKMVTWQPWQPLMKEAPANQWAWPPAKNN